MHDETMSNRILYILTALAAGLFAAFGDILLNYWAKFSDRNEYMIWGALLFNASFFIFSAVLKRGFLAESLVIYIVANVVFVGLVSFFVLQEPMNSYQWFWLFVASVAVVAFELVN